MDHVGDEPVGLVRLLNDQDMAVSFHNHTPDLPFFITSQPPDQILHMWVRGDHGVAVAMQHQNPFFAHLSSNPRQLLVGFGVPARGDGLQDESLAGEARLGGEKAFVQLEGGEAVAVGGEGAVGVWGGEPVRGEDAGFYRGELSVDGAGDAAMGEKGRLGW